MSDSSAANPQHSPVRFIERRRNPAPRMNDRVAFVSIMLTTIMLAYGGLIGPASILVFYALWLSRFKYRQIYTVRMTRDVLILLPFPLMAIVSSLWSRYPTTTLYTSLEYASSVVCAIIMARLVRTTPLVRGVVAGTVVVLAASLINGRYGVDAFSGNYSLVGLFGSKNMVGLFAEIGIIFSLFATLLPGQRLISRLAFGIAPMLMCMVTLELSKSASSLLSLLIVLGLLLTVYIITRLPRIYRKFSFIIIAIWFLVITVTGATLGWQETVLQSFGKTSTLTGRTTLWEKGMEIGWSSPAIGIGYAAFWVQGNLEAERLWYKFGIKSRNGFHFHNTFVEAFAELGMIGVLLVGILFLSVTLPSLWLLLEHGMVMEYCVSLALGVMFLVRSFVELDILGTFSIGPFLLYAIPPRLATLRLEQQAAQPPAEGLLHKNKAQHANNQR